VNEDKASRYHRLRRRAELSATALAGIFLFALLVSGGSLMLREYAWMGASVFPAGFEEQGTVIVFALGLAIILYLIELPFSFYQGYVLEHRYNLSNQTLSHWRSDHAKAGVLAAVFSTVGAAIVYATLGWSRAWWWLLSAAIFTLAMVILAQIAPVLLLPLFYRFKPLDRPALVERLTALAARAETRIRGVFEWTLSAHTKKANAALAGLGRTRRILLSDTLLADYSDDEIEVVLAHELSHHVHHDLWRGVAVQAALLVAGFYLADRALVRFAEPLALRGLDDPAGWPLLMLVGGICSFVFMPLVNLLSRAHERRADHYALEMTRQPEAFVSAMKRLAQQNMAEEHPSKLVQWLFYSHPPTLDRIEAARRWAAHHVPRVAGVALMLLAASMAVHAQNPRKTNIAHRGASGYAPEHTLASYRLALEMGADFVEQDLAVTKDGMLICLHDPTLDRTTNVEELFPDRSTVVTWEGKTVRSWLANDFTLAEIKQLDAGSWFDAKFKGERVPTFDEAVALVKGKAGMFPELKTPEVYAGRPVNFEQLVADALDKHGLRGAKADPKTPLILQTFSEPGARKLAAMKIGVPVVLLINSGRNWDSADKVRAWKGTVNGFGPAKEIVATNPDFVKWAHAEQMIVTPYTFRASNTGKYANVKAEMEHFLYTLGVDGLFTDNPDQFPRREREFRLPISSSPLGDARPASGEKGIRPPFQLALTSDLPPASRASPYTLRRWSDCNRR
jgi:glycerophosphoryl diester phosphodiesterase/Zn-dependent protease with chaperone function